MKTGLNIPIGKREAAKENSKGAGNAILSYGKIIALSLLAACSTKLGEEENSPVIPKADEASMKAVFNGEKVQIRFEKDGFAGIAEELKNIQEKMAPENRAQLDSVLELMETNLAGIVVNRDSFSDNPNIRASASTPRAFHDPALPHITLNTNWRADNGIDLALAVHELGHIADLLKSRATLDEKTWIKIYGAPGKATEIRTELKAWELQLVFLNELSEGLLDEFYKAVTKAKSREQADQLLKNYTEKISQKLNLRKDQQGLLTRWLQIYFNYKAPERFGIPCRWTYDFVVQIAGEYYAQGIPMYELDLQPKDQSDPERCVDPLPEGTYDYKSYHPYKELKPGIVGPSSQANSFN